MKATHDNAYESLIGQHLGMSISDPWGAVDCLGGSYMHGTIQQQHSQSSALLVQLERVINVGAWSSDLLLVRPRHVGLKFNPATLRERQACNMVLMPPTHVTSNPFDEATWSLPPDFNLCAFVGDCVIIKRGS